MRPSIQPTTGPTGPCLAKAQLILTVLFLKVLFRKEKRSPLPPCTSPSSGLLFACHGHVLWIAPTSSGPGVHPRRSSAGTSPHACGCLHQLVVIALVLVLVLVGGGETVSTIDVGVGRGSGFTFLLLLLFHLSVTLRCHIPQRALPHASPQPGLRVSTLGLGAARPA